MPTAIVAIETLELLWYNYLNLAEHVDIECMLPEITAEHLTNKMPVRPFRIAAWLGRQAFFIAAWSLWEHYTRELCGGLPATTKKRNADSHVSLVRKSMESNGLAFADYEWFVSANSLRNILVHFGGRAAEPRAQNLLERTHAAFPGIGTYGDGYIKLDHCHAAELVLKIERFIETTTHN